MDVIEIILNYDSTRCLAICKRNYAVDDLDEFAIKIFSLKSFSEKASFPITGKLLRMNEIAQNDSADLFAIAYSMDGEFNVKILDVNGTERYHINVNDVLQLDRNCKPISGVLHPLITCCFLPNNRLFICAYHRKK
jgi:hypothetical protein